MNLAVARSSVVALTVLVLSACASVGPSSDASSPNRAVIELAISQTCVAGGAVQCISVNDEDIVPPSSFEDADVQDADIVESNGQYSVHVTFTDAGGKVLNTVSAQAADAGNGTRMVLKARGWIIGAPVALAPLEGREVSIAVSPNDSAQDLLDAILGR